MSTKPDQAQFSIDTVHDLQGAVLFFFMRSCEDPLHELFGFVSQSQLDKPVDGEGRVAYPGVPVIPIPNAADFFR